MNVGNVMFSLFVGNSFSAFTHPGAGERSGQPQWAAAVQRLREQVGVSGALLKGTSSVDVDVGECCSTTPSVHIFAYRQDLSRPPSSYQFSSLTSRPRMPLLSHCQHKALSLCQCIAAY